MKNTYYAVSIRTACGILFDRGFTMSEIETIIPCLTQATEGYYYAKDLPIK